MSRIGKVPIPVPDGVRVEVRDGELTVRGARGELRRRLVPEVTLRQEGPLLIVTPVRTGGKAVALYGLTRTLVANMVRGVTEGFEKKLEISGVGYRAQLQGRVLSLSVGFSHPITYDPPDGVEFEVGARSNEITVRGIDKELVGQVAAEIRGFRPPEPYKGKGIRYVGERVRRKIGKAAK